MTQIDTTNEPHSWSYFNVLAAKDGPRYVKALYFLIKDTDDLDPFTTSSTDVTTLLAGQAFDRLAGTHSSTSSACRAFSGSAWG